MDKFGEIKIKRKCNRR